MIDWTVPIRWYFFTLRVKFLVNAPNSAWRAPPGVKKNNSQYIPQSTFANVPRVQIHALSLGTQGHVHNCTTSGITVPVRVYIMSECYNTEG